METGLKVSDAMTMSPYHITKGTTLSDCAKEMAKRHVGALLVKEEGVLLGVVTEQDIVRKGIAEGLDHMTAPVSEIMEQKLITIEPHKDVHQALVTMRDANIRHLPVVQDDELLGLLTLKDVLKIQPQLFDLLVDKFEVRDDSKIRRGSPGEGICELCGTYAEELMKIDGAMACRDCRQE